MLPFCVCDGVCGEENDEREAKERWSVDREAADLDW